MECLCPQGIEGLHLEAHNEKSGRHLFGSLRCLWKSQVEARIIHVKVLG
jgi:hypothetical protein